MFTTVITNEIKHSYLYGKDFEVNINGYTKVKNPDYSFDYYDNRELDIMRRNKHFVNVDAGKEMYRIDFKMKNKSKEPMALENFKFEVLAFDKNGKRVNETVSLYGDITNVCDSLGLNDKYVNCTSDSEKEYYMLFEIPQDKEITIIIRDYDDKNNYAVKTFK